MGAWGSGNLENDNAADWAYQLFEAGDHLPLVTAALAGVAGMAPDGTVEAPTASEALAAAEAVAAWLGRSSVDCNDTVRVWARAQASKGAPPPALLATARSAVRRVRDASELRELWAEGESLNEWLAVVDGLLGRLGA